MVPSPPYSLFLDKLKPTGCSDRFLAQFLWMLEFYFQGKGRGVSLSQVQGVGREECLAYSSLDDRLAQLGRESMSQLAVLKLNGGLATTMGCEGPKSLVEVGFGLSFLDIICRQMTHLRSVSGVTVPLLLMNSFATDQATSDEMKAFDYASFLQHQVPRIDRVLQLPVTFPDMPLEEWAPPGHGDVFWSLAENGVLDQLLATGVRYLFLSNSDNLGATVDPAILGRMIDRDLDMMMEVTARTSQDVKGGAVVRADHRLQLLERAQVLPSELGLFENIDRFSVFNTNSIWVDLQKVQARLQVDQFHLPVISNAKHVAGKDIVQLEMAMGSAIEIFDKVELLHVPRTRFLPIKGTSDLTLLRSRLKTIHQDGRLEMTE